MIVRTIQNNIHTNPPIKKVQIEKIENNMEGIPTKFINKNLNNQFLYSYEYLKQLICDIADKNSAI